LRSSILRPDDFIEGMFVTIKDVVKKQSDFDEDSMTNPIQAMMMQGQSSSKNHYLELLKGTVIRIDAINLPFIMTTVFENISQPGHAPKTHSIPLDVREAEFIKLNEEYVSAYMGKSPLMTLLQGEQFNNIQNIEGYNTLQEILDVIMVRLKDEENKRHKDED